MQALALFLVPFFTSLASLLAQYFTRKAAVATALVGGVVAITAAFYAAIQALMTGLQVGVANSDFLMVWWSIWPTNGATCISAALGADVAAFAWRYQKRLMETIATI